MTWNRAVLAVLLLAATAGDATAACRDHYEDDVTTSYRPVSWDDFKGRLSSRHNQGAARIATALHLRSFEVEVAREEDGGWVARPREICLHAEMDKLRSAYRSDGKNDRSLLHEQTHFDITEVFARRLRRRLAGLEERGASDTAAELALRRRLQQELAASHRAWDDTQDRYDRETRNGRSRVKQRRWDKQVRRWLEETR